MGVHDPSCVRMTSGFGGLGWEPETMMPSGAAEQRGEEMAALAGVLHTRRADPRLGALLEAAEAPDAAA